MHGGEVISKDRHRTKAVTETAVAHSTKVVALVAEVIEDDAAPRYSFVVVIDEKRVPIRCVFINEQHHFSVIAIARGLGLGVFALRPSYGSGKSVGMQTVRTACTITGAVATTAVICLVELAIQEAGHQELGCVVVFSASIRH